MVFNSFSYLAFFLIALIGRFLMGRNRFGKTYLGLLLLISLLFYASFVPVYTFLLLFTTLVDYFAGQWIHHGLTAARKKLWLTLSLTSNLLLLCYFKYSAFALETVAAGLRGMGLSAGWNTDVHWVLPIGISFFTFQSMSYTIDVYRGKIKPVGSYWRFLLFVSFFTHLISGPIVRASELLPQFDRKRKIRVQVCFQGIYLIIAGFFMKLVVANNIGPLVDRFWNDGNTYAGMPLLLAVLFSCQIYADFAGYTQIALGSAYLLGFRLPPNFNSPYLASSFREFWTRWHITLSRWIRDYLYIPLGGGRGSFIRTSVILMSTMLLAGLWHGAGAAFIIWGGIHGAALMTERLLGLHRPSPTRSKAVRFLWAGVVQATVLVGWIFFRSGDQLDAFNFIWTLFFGQWNPGRMLMILPAFAFAVPVLLTHLRTWVVERGWVGVPSVREKAVLAGLMLCGILVFYGKNNAFLYFQF